MVTYLLIATFRSRTAGLHQALLSMPSLSSNVLWLSLGYSSCAILLNMVEYWRLSLDNREAVVTLAVELMVSQIEHRI